MASSMFHSTDGCRPSSFSSNSFDQPSTEAVDAWRWKTGDSNAAPERPASTDEHTIAYKQAEHKHNLTRGTDQTVRHLHTCARFAIQNSRLYRPRQVECRTTLLPEVVGGACASNATLFFGKAVEQLGRLNFHLPLDSGLSSDINKAKS